MSNSQSNTSSEEVKKYYDGYSERQQKESYNLRHYTIVDALKRFGLKKNDNVLEIGCGIGALSALIFKQIPNSKFRGVDISPESIRIANERFNGKPNISFIVNDMKSFDSDIKFDFVVLPDVLEHIPLEQHKNIFETIAKVSSPNAKIFINIPAPELNAYCHIHEKENLQVIDLVLPLGEIISNAENSGFMLEYFKRHAVFRKNPEYVMMYFSKKRPIDYSEKRSMLFRIPDKFFKRIFL